jgi:hypothetical protein
MLYLINGNGPTQTIFIKSNRKDSEEGNGPTKFLIVEFIFSIKLTEIRYQLLNSTCCINT